MRFGYTILYVRDVARALDFYERGFGFGRGYVEEAGTYAELDTGGTLLALVQDEQAESHLPGGFRRSSPDEPPPGIEIAFVTDDVEGAYARAVEAGAMIVAEPEAKPWGQTVGYLRDLDGVLIELCTEPE